MEMADCSICGAGTYSFPCSASYTTCSTGKYLSDASTSAAAHDDESDCTGLCLVGKSTNGPSDADCDMASDCKPCLKGSSTLGLAGAPCVLCPNGLTSEDHTTCLNRQCKKDEFNNDGTYEKCNNTMSVILVAGSALSFLLAIWYVEKIATSRQKTMRFRVLATFFQTAELTTLVKISWPKSVYFTLPF